MPIPFERKWACLFQRGFERIAGPRPAIDDHTIAALVTSAARCIDASFSTSTILTITKRETDLGMGEYERASESMFGDGGSGIRITRTELCSSDGAGPSVTNIRVAAHVHGLERGLALEFCANLRPEPFHNAGLTLIAKGAAPNENARDRALEVLATHFVDRA